jgi:hypothetical protein
MIEKSGGYQKTYNKMLAGRNHYIFSPSHDKYCKQGGTTAYKFHAWSCRSYLVTG